MKKKGGERLKTISSIQRVIQSPGLCLFLLFFSFYYLTNPGQYLSGDQYYMHKVAANIVDHGRLGFVMGEHAPEVTEGNFVKGTSGLFYAKWGMGQSLIEVPFYFLHRLFLEVVRSLRHKGMQQNAWIISEMAFAFLAPSLVSAIGIVLVFRLGLLMAFSVRLSILLSLIYGFATMVWPYSKFLLSETTLNVAILGGAYGVIAYARTRNAWFLGVAGACMGFAFLTKVVSVAIVPVMILYILAACGMDRGMRDLGIFFSPPFLLLFIVQLWHNEIRYGNMLDFGYAGSFDRLGFSNPIFVGLWGLFLSPGKSFFLYNPVTILAGFSLPAFFRRKKKELLLFVGICVAIVVPHACWWSWSGDWAWGPRFLLPMIPYFILPLGFLFSSPSMAISWKRSLVVAMIFFSILVQLVGAAVNPHTFLKIRSEAVDSIIVTKGGEAAHMFFDVSSVNFIPMFSPVLGNWWLFKHILFRYDLASDPPWRRMEDFHLPSPVAIAGERVPLFSWLSAFPSMSPSSAGWVYPLACLNLLMVVWWGLRLSRFIRPHQ